MRHHGEISVALALSKLCLYNVRINKSLAQLSIFYNEKHCQKCSRFGTSRLRPFAILTDIQF